MDTFVSRNGDAVTWLRKEKSFDNGKTWYPTEQVRPGSVDSTAKCHCDVSYQWVKTDPLCDGLSLYACDKLQVKQDCGEYVDVVPQLLRYGNIIRRNSTLCGYKEPLNGQIVGTFTSDSVASQQGYTKRENGNNIFVGLSSVVDAETKQFKSNFDINTVTSVEFTTHKLKSLTSLVPTSHFTSMASMFQDNAELTSIEATDWDTSKVTRMNAMFMNCTSINSLDLSAFDVSNVIDMTSMFGFCSKLQAVNLSNWDMNANVVVDSMFEDCTSLRIIFMKNCSQETIDKINAVKPSTARVITD